MFTARITRTAIAAAGAVAVAVALSGCGSSNPLDDPDSSKEPSSSDTIVIGSQAYYSNTIIAEIYAQALEKAGHKVDRKFNIGQRDAYMPDIESGKIALFPEYTGNLMEYLGGKSDANSPDDVYAALKKVLPKGLTALDFAQAADQDTYTVTKKYAEEHGLVSIADLSKVSDATIGAAPEFEQRPYGPEAAKKAYGVDLKFSATGQTTLEALLAGTVQVADIYSADPAFETEDIVALKDPKNLILSSNVVPIANEKIAADIADTINAISKKLTTEELVKLNVQSTKDKREAPAIAKDWLTAQGLL
ncbi:ABC transporter substrate-binding protein [Microbacterium sp.]|uniref:ABC transporter substrate-binding protein n=1 Tax=Microbacterium sp. TaxID=51671 RepID=UPI00333ED412